MVTTMRSATGFLPFIVICILLLPVGAHAQPQRLDAAALERTQVYLDSLWSVYDAVDDAASDGAAGMRHLLDSWADMRIPGPVEPNSAAEVFRQVFSDVFRSKYYSDPRTGEELRFFSSFKPYMFLPDKINCAVIEDAAIWDTLSGRVGDHRARNGFLFYSEFPFDSVVPQLEMPSKIVRIERAQYEAIQCFINGLRIAQEDGEEQSPPTDRYEWIWEHARICRPHGGYRYPLYARPLISAILLNHDMTEAVVDLSTRCHTGEKRLYRRTGDTWTLVDTYDSFEI